MLQPVSTLDRQVTLRSVDDNDLFVFRSHLRLGEPAFRIAAPRAWNSLPSDVKKADSVKTFKNDERLSCFANFTATFNIFIALHFYVNSWSAYVVSCLVHL